MALDMSNGQKAGQRLYSPCVVRKAAREYMLSFDVSDVSPWDVAIDIVGEQLVVTTAEGCARRFMLPEDADGDAVEAAFHDKQLDVTIPRRATAH